MAPTSAVESSSADAQEKSLTLAELLGSNRSPCLLSSLNLSRIRQWLLRCGDMAEVTYDAFNYDKSSEYCGACCYGIGDLLTETRFPFPSDYEVVDLLYASAKPQGLLGTISPDGPCLGSIFQGYVAVSSDDYAQRTGLREIYVVWRGTQTRTEGINNLVNFPQISIRPLSTPPPYWSAFVRFLSWGEAWDEVQDWAAQILGRLKDWFNGVRGEPMVANTWYNIYTQRDPASRFSKFSAREQLIFKLRQLVERYKDENLSIVCVGHSLRGTQAVLSAFDIALQGLSKKSNGPYFPAVTAVVFACPRIGNNALCDLLMRKVPKFYVVHVLNEGDIVPTVPLKWTPVIGDYADIGSSEDRDGLEEITVSHQEPGLCRAS